MPTDKIKGLLTDIGTEELAHLEMVSAIVYQLTRNLSEADLKKYGFDKYFVDHTTAIYPASASGVPFTAAYFQSKGDAFADLTEDLAADGAIRQRLHLSKVPKLRCFRQKNVGLALSLLQSYMGNICRI